MKNTRNIFVQCIALGLLLLAGVVSSSAQTCPAGLGTPIYINSLPYSTTGRTTCGNANSIFHTTATLCAEVWQSYGKDQVYIFTPATTDSFAILIKTDRATATMTIYDGCPLLGQGGACVAHVEMENSFNPPYAGMLLQLSAGVTYYLVVDDAAAPAQQCIPSYDLFIFTQPANDDIGGAINLTTGSTCNPVTGNTYAASRTLPVPNVCGGSVDDDVWYKFTATSTSHTITVDPIAPTANIDPVVDVRDGGYGGTNIACSYLGDNDGVTDVLELNNLTVGHTYYVRVCTRDNVVEFRGYFTICVTTPATPPSPPCVGAPGSPTNGQSGFCPGSGVILDWPAAAGATSYDIYIGTSATPPFAANVSGTTQLTSALPAGTYYWQVRPKNAGGTASGCAVWSFTVADNIAPVITCPANATVSANAACQVALAAYTPTSVSDNCGSPSVVQVPAAISTIGLGATTVTLRATDNSGNSASCTFRVTVNDQTAPMITCPANSTVSANAACQAVLAAYSPFALQDNCTASPTVAQSPAAGTLISGGATTVTLRATDAAGNSGNCTFSVSITDQIAPTITCPANATVASNAACQASLAAYTPTLVSDNCGAPTVAQLPVAGSTIGSGTTTVTLRATDAASNSASCTFTVTVNDQSLPTITCPANSTVSANAACQAVLAAYSPVSLNDNCTASPTVAQLPAAGTLISGGATTVTLRATDAAGNSGTCSFSVSITDQIAPTISCPGPITVAANAACQATLSTYAPASVNDNCGAPTVLQIPAAGATLPAGASTVTLRATDAAGNSASCTFSITVMDQTVPTISCPGLATVIATAACQATLGSYAPATISDNCSAPTVLQIPAAGTMLAAGTSTVTLRATDAAGNSAGCTFSVTVVDQTPPAITCPASVTVAVTTSCQAILGNYVAAATATDNCTASPTKTQLPAAGTMIGLGATTVTLRATDAAGNSATCSFNVAVTDQTAPLITCPANTTVAANASCSGSLGSYAAISVSDNCGANPTVTQSPAAGTPLTGTTTALSVTLTANDGNGNTAACTFSVSLRDGTPPVAKCRSAVLNLTANGTTTLLPSSVDNASTDNCSFSLTVTPATFSCANLGTNIVTLRATDTGGNTGTCTATVTVRDLTPPTALCKNINVYLDEEGQATITPAAVNNNSYDACGIATMTINNNQFNCGQLGAAVSVQLTLRDANNNTSSCIAKVSVKDNLPPTAACESTTVQLSASGYVTVNSSDLTGGSYDNCSVWSYTPTVKVFTKFNIGVNNLAITVKDYSNNAATCVAQVTVLPYGGGNLQQPGNGESPAYPDVAAALSGSERLELSVFPNPTAGTSNVRFHLATEQPYRLRLLDINGQLIMDRNFQGYSGENTVALELEQLTPGIYWIDLQTGGMHGGQRVVVQR